MNFKRCDEEKKLLVCGGASSGKGHNTRETVTVCACCGQFRVSGHVNSECVNVTFRLWDDETLAAAGKANQRALDAER